MNAVIWARVSSREQREGYSLDAQLRATRGKAEREGWQVVREFVVAESAKRGAERVAFNQMVQWVRKNACKESIGAIVSHKLDRVCRNMRDAVRMQELEDTCGVKLAFVDNEFGPGAAGSLSFNVMAAVSQYYSDNLRQEVLKGKDEKVCQGWLPCGAPYGYMNVQDRDEPIQPHPEQAQAVIRAFELYSAGNVTFELLSEQLKAEGHIYRPSHPSFTRTGLSYILNNRFYIGEIIWHGQNYPGKHRPLVDRYIFGVCQDILNGKNRRAAKVQDALTGGLFTCLYCGSFVTAERIRRKLRNGGVREHFYYRCANNQPGSDHPRVRWRAEAVESAIAADLDTMRFEDAEQAIWFRRSLLAAISDVDGQRRRQRSILLKRQTELTNQQERLLSIYMSGDIDAGTFQNKSTDLKGQLAELEKSLQRCRDMDFSCGDKVIAAFDFTQRAAELWRGSKMDKKRRILEAVSLNRTLSDTTLCVQKRKPFDILAKRPSIQSNRGDWI